MMISFRCARAPSPGEPFAGRGVCQRAGDHPPQGGGFGGGKRAVGLHPLHGEAYLLLVVGVFEGLVHQDAEIAGREFHLFLLLEITLRGSRRRRSARAVG